MGSQNDRWAVGVLIYQMVAGYPPFYDEDRVAMFKNICQVKYSVPSHFSKVRPLAKGDLPMWTCMHASCGSGWVAPKAVTHVRRTSGT